MKLYFPFLVLTFITCFIFSSSFSQDTQEAEEKEGKNEISVFIGGTTQMDEGTSAFTLGLDYQYRIGKLIGLGFLFDHAMGDIKSTLIGPFVAFHLGKLELLGAPALEFSDGETNPTFRLGAAYEFELPNEFSISPSINYDNERREEISMVYGVSVAKSF